MTHTVTLRGLRQNVQEVRETLMASTHHIINCSSSMQKLGRGVGEYHVVVHDVDDEGNDVSVVSMPDGTVEFSGPSAKAIFDIFGNTFHELHKALAHELYE